MTSETFKIDHVAGRYQVRLLGPDMRPCLTLKTKTGKPRNFKNYTAAKIAAIKYQEAVTAWARF